MEKKNEVHVVFEGYAFTDPEDFTSMRANCSCTLIRTKNNKNIIIDTMTAWDGHKLSEALLNSHGLQPADIYAVICTHGHSDHIGGNYLFQQANWHIVGTSISQRDKYYDNFEANDEFRVDDDEEIIVMRTPGHTLACVSVVVEDTQYDGKIVGICGDLFENSDDINNSSVWIDSGTEDPKAQRIQRLRMAEMCDYIIPGHGPMFQVTEEMRAKLRLDLDANNAPV